MLMAETLGLKSKGCQGFYKKHTKTIIEVILDSLKLCLVPTLAKFALLNIKWICPTAPTCPVAILGGFPRTAWFDVRELSEDSPDDFEGLDASVAHIANLLSTEPADIKLGIGDFSMGVATALYSATCFAQGKYGNEIDYPVNLRAIVGLSGWLPGSRSEISWRDAKYGQRIQ
ncbi:hypothetical protein TEA_013242 [Camellia sinensis var. sinensis]|uniref:Phospholipase/carboxylesterase/thioesterase domain-containing protein n=1 Tax=Camellia sinensis var. sinensis TaxID=542762 RepID=A0A4S4DCY1_CAMSN|nr:hypothetical protein TEA_013242 [Camellia sinensis var. sinensis]